MAVERRQNEWLRLAWGLIILTAGVVLWLDRQDRVDAREYFEWWPLALVAIGLAHAAHRRWFAAVGWTAIGLLFLPQFGFTFQGIRTLLALWPLLIALGGLSLMAQALRPRGPGTMYTATAVMAGNTLLVGSQEFGGADLVAVMGGCDLELGGAGKPAHDITINVLAFWGGIEIRVPHGWRIVNRVSPILGGFEDKTSQSQENAPRVIVRGTAIMGGVEVKNSEDTRA